MNEPSDPSYAGRGFAWLAAATVLLSAFLLFQVQPLISRTILPWFGGSPAVWTTSMLFFQVLLLAGYGYAHWLTGLGGSSSQRWVHLAFLVAACLCLPIIPDSAWKPKDSLAPIWRILLLLSVHVGLPYFLLSSTGPLVQAWYARVRPGSPYRLYALSNLGSLAALLTYPLVFEPRWSTATQGVGWAAGFVVFAAMCGGLAWLFASYRHPASSADRPQEDFETSVSEPWLAWLLLPALASVMLLAVTARICQDIAVSPFMWVAPLSIYLLSFIICFDREQWYRPILFGVLAAVSVLAVCNVMLADEIQDIYERIGLDQIPGLNIEIGAWDNNILVESLTALVMLFAVCMVCHGELVRRKPAPSRLTNFYMFVAAGGALGGVTVGVLCPTLLNFNAEWNVGLVLSFLLAVGVALSGQAACVARRRVEHPKSSSLLDSMIFWAGLSAAALGLIGVLWAQADECFDSTLAKRRSFYGVLSVREYRKDTPSEGRGLYNGRILHGYQHCAPDRRRIATTYYDKASGVGLTLDHLQTDGPKRVGVIGLGAGTIAAYGQPGDVYRFYEINPQAIEFAEQYFTFLEDSAAEVQPVLGDGRISLEQEPPQAFHVLVLDAFTGDSIPTHLLTAEAFDGFVKHLDPQGVIAVHVSNRHLELTPVVAALADLHGLQCWSVESSGGDSLAECSASWILLTNNQQFLQRPEVSGAAVQLSETAPRVLWTDTYSNLFQILK